LASSGIVIAVFVIPIAFSFIYGGTVLSLSMMGPVDITQAPSPGSIKIIEMKPIYSTSERITAQVFVDDPDFSCGDLYVTIYDVSAAKKAVKQGAFFDQCFGSSGMLPTDDNFSEKLDAGKYLMEVQLFDKNGDRFLTTSHKFTVN
jgi:hypothetical protein